jgi:lysophospholipase L1-like esterase
MNSKLCFLLLGSACIAAFSSSLAFAQEKASTISSAAKIVRPELIPIDDIEGLPRVLLLGDSVSIGYTLPVRKLLEGKANVHRNAITNVSSQLAAESVFEWLGNKKWDVIYFNFGAYDLAIEKDGAMAVPPDRYEANLRLIIAKLRAHSPGARLIFATTTPVPTEQIRSKFKFLTENSEAYHMIAAKVMRDNGVTISDLRTLVTPRLAEWQIPENIHFRPAAYDAIAHEVADRVTSALKEPPSKAITSSTAKGLRVFSCGHSFHIWVVPLLNEIAMYAGIPDHQIAGRSGIGGSTVLKHWDVPDDKNIAKQALTEGRVDVLTLSPIWLPDEGIENFAKLAFAHNPNIRITVQEYWLPNDEYNPVYPLDTRKKVDHNATTIPALRKAQEQYDHGIDEHVRAINKKLGKDVLVTVPVGQAVVALREKIIAGQCPGISQQTELFRDNWGHPTQPIMALAGYCHFAVIYQRSPVGLPRPAILSRNPAWDDKLNRLLQELAWAAVTEHPMCGLSLSAPK